MDSTRQINDVFISYGRIDSKTFAIALRDRLTQANYRVWLDLKEIPPAVKYQEYINDAIAQADNFIFLISPRSIHSHHCQIELDLALRFNKRIIPVMHVEEISFEVWQARHPHGIETDWQDYQAEGLHSSRIGMPKGLSQLNWLMYREGQDNPEIAFQQLVDTLNYAKQYVHLHTKLLLQALLWENHQRQTQYLLTGADLPQAETWLKMPFEKGKMPCPPSDLHCDYITESIKNARNLMTEVFLCHSEQNLDIAENVRHSLQRNGITVWNYRTDIQASSDFTSTIRTGIEQADNLVYFLSREAQQSDYCPQEVAYALELNKRVIPLLVDAIEPKEFSEKLRSLQFIKFTQIEEPTQYEKGIQKLLKTLSEDAAYHNEHKQLLAKALKWKQHDQNPSLLLRGYNLRCAETWLQTALTRTQHRATPLQIEFIETSLKCPPVGSLDVFISYSRANASFARKLNEALQIQGKTTWFDQESIASGTDFQKEIHRGIETSDNFLFILSPQSVNSPFCDDEVTYAESLGKRILTILYREVDTKDLHRVLRKIEWLDFRLDSSEFEPRFRDLLRVLNTDREYLTTHTQLSLKALEWEAKDHDNSLLLRGKVLKTAEKWMQEALEKHPRPTTLQQDFVQLSQSRSRSEKLRSKILKSASVVAAGILTASLGLSYSLFNQSQQGLAISIETLNQVADKAYEDNPASISNLLNGLRAAGYLEKLWSRHRDKANLNARVAGNLIRDLTMNQELKVLQRHNDLVQALAFAPSGAWLVSGDWQGTIKIWDETGQEVSTVNGQAEGVTDIAIHPEGNLMATAGWDGTAIIWDITGNGASTQISHAETFKGHQDALYGITFSHNGNHIATASLDGTAKIWSLSGQELLTLQGHTDQVLDIEFSFNDETIATASTDQTIKIWSHEGQLLNEIQGHASTVFAVAFHPRGDFIASVDKDGIVGLWRQDGTSIFKTNISDTALYDVSFIQGGELIAVAGADGAIHILDLKGNPISQITAHEDRINKIINHPQDSLLATASNDKGIRLWALDNMPMIENNSIYRISVDNEENVFAYVGRQGLAIISSSNREKAKISISDQDIYALDLSKHGQLVLGISPKNDLENREDKQYITILNYKGNIIQQFETGHKRSISDLKISPDDNLIATSSFDKTIEIWTMDGIKKTTIQDADAINRVNWFSNSQHILSGNDSGTIKVWDTEGNQLISFSTYETAIRNVILTPDETQIATSGVDGIVKIWTLEGNLIQEFSVSAAEILGLAFSPDGQYLATSGDDKFIRIWDSDGYLQYEWQGHTDSVNDLYFSTDSTWLLSAGSDGRLIKWRMHTNLEQLVDAGCLRIKNYLEIHSAQSEVELLCEQSTLQD